MQSAANVFGGLKKTKAAEPDLKVLHAKIGQLTLKNDFLESALTKPVPEIERAGLLSTKR